MIDIKLIRENPERFKKAAIDKHFNADIDRICHLDTELRDVKSKLQDITTGKNSVGKTIPQLCGPEKQAALEKSEISMLIDAISETKNQIFDLQNQLGEISKAEKLEKQHCEILRERDKAFEKYQSYSKLKEMIPALIKLKVELRKALLVWLDEIETSNISRDIAFKDDFTPLLGQETIGQLKGSTKTRAILAYHAAMLELLAQNTSASFAFMILDTPKQHEIHSDDLDKYFKALKNLCQEYDIQVIFSTKQLGRNCSDPVYIGKRNGS